MNKHDPSARPAPAQDEKHHCGKTHDTLRRSCAPGVWQCDECKALDAEQARPAPAQEQGEAMAILADIANFGDPDGQRGMALAKVRLWGERARALLARNSAREARMPCEQEPDGQC